MPKLNDCLAVDLLELIQKLIKTGSPGIVESVCSLLLKQTKFMLEKDADVAFSEILPQLVVHSANYVQSRVGLSN